jgi:hypothetical protein
MRPTSTHVECSYDCGPNGRPLWTATFLMPSLRALLDHRDAGVVVKEETVAVRPELRVRLPRRDAIFLGERSMPSRSPS